MVRINCEVEHPLHTYALEAGIACPFCGMEPNLAALVPTGEDPWADA